MTTTHRGFPVSHLTGFVGRDTELRDLRALVSSRRLVTITGQAGVGKSRTAGRVGDTLRRSLGGATTLIPMAGVAATQLAAEIGDALGAVGADVSDIVGALGERPHLLILDDLDDPVTAASTIEAVLRSTTEARILVTARWRTGIGGESPFVLSPLDLPLPAAYQSLDNALASATCALLVQRIIDADPSFDRCAASLHDLVAVCRASDGLPRFVEAAARAVCALGLRETAIAVTEDPTVLDVFLSAGTSAQSSCAVLAAEIARLSTPAADLLHRLALMESGADVRFAAELFAGGNLARLAAPAAELVDHSLVRSETAGGERRLRVPLHYRHHLREEGAAAGGERDQRMVHDALLEHLRHCAATWFSEDQLAGIQFLNRHAADITRLLGEMAGDSDRAHEALELISSLRYYWQLHPVDPWPRARDWLETALALDQTRDLVTLRAMLTDAYIAFHEGDLHGARTQLRAIDSTFDPTPADVTEQLFTEFVGALVSLAEGDLERAEAGLSYVLATSLDTDEREHLGEKYWHLAACQIAAGKQQQAVTTLADGLAYCDRVCDNWGRAYMWCLLALIEDRQGSHAQAAQRVRESVAVMATFSDRVGLALCVQLLAGFSVRRRDDGDATAVELPVEPASLARPPVPLPEFVRGEATRYGPPPPLPDVSSLGDVLGLADGDRRTPPSSLEDPSNVLSAREMEIAALVAEGLGNPAIAARLVLSRRTVEGHVQRILAKLGFRSRSQIAVWAAQHAAADSTPNS